MYINDRDRQCDDQPGLGVLAFAQMYIFYKQIIKYFMCDCRKKRGPGKGRYKTAYKNIVLQWALPWLPALAD